MFRASTARAIAQAGLGVLIAAIGLGLGAYAIGHPGALVAVVALVFIVVGPTTAVVILRRATEELRVYPRELALVGGGQARHLVARNEVGGVHEHRERGSEGGYLISYRVVLNDGSTAFTVRDVYARSTMRDLAAALGVAYTRD